MIINKANIILMIVSVILSIPAGIFTAWGSLRYYKEESIFKKGMKESFKKEPGRYFLALFLNLILLALITYFKGNILSGEGNISIPKLIEYLKYILVTPVLLIALFVDIEYKVIPNRVSILVLEIGLFFAAFSGIYNIHKFTDSLFGMLVAFGTFLVISILGGLIAGKEAMGLGDLKFVTPVGLFFGMYGMINLIMTSFVTSAVISVFVVIVRAIKKEPDKYIPFGPFIVLSFYITLFAPQNFALTYFMMLSDRLGNLITKGQS